MSDSLAIKVVTAAQAIELIRDGDVITTSGFVGTGTPDELLLSLENRWKQNSSPK